MDISIKKSGNEVKIYINRLLHVLILDRITSIHSWNEEDKWWKIEIQTKDNKILLEYDCFDKWEKILNLLDNG